jgi:hypothetical protein
MCCWRAGNDAAQAQAALGVAEAAVAAGCGDGVEDDVSATRRGIEEANKVCAAA